MKRALKITFILVLIIALILLGMWFFSRQTAKKNGAVLPSFKQFFTFTPSVTLPNSGQNGDLSAVFTPPDGSSPSQFTNDPLTPTGTTNPDGTISTSGSFGTTGTSGGTGGYNSQNPYDTSGTLGSPSSTGGSGTTGPTGPTVIPLQCSSADSTITFTPTEIAQLTALQARFNAIAGNLQTDGAVTAMQGQYNSYKAKDDQLKEMALYCENKIPLIADASLNRRVATPFWHDSTTDNDSFFTFPGIFNQLDPISQGVTAGERELDDVLRINLW